MTFGRGVVLSVCTIVGTIAATAAVSAIYEPPEASPSQAAMREDTAIPSDSEGALLPPGQWNCELYIAEYREWLNSGQAANEWRFYGKDYVEKASGLKYSWKDWLRWVGSSDCELGELVERESASQGSLDLIGGIVTAVGASAFAAGGSLGPNDSPG